MIYKSTKTYGPEVGLSACFRQWGAESHCRFLHGYALSVKLEFSATHLDDNNWVVDFGSLKPVKQWLVDTFDHKTLVAADDPEKDQILGLAGLGIIDGLEVPKIGCEAFAEMVADFVGPLIAATYYGRVWLSMVEVREHGANSAIVEYGQEDW